MNTDTKIAAIGMTGSFGTYVANFLNEHAAALVAVLTILALIPLAVERWLTFYRKHPRAVKTAAVCIFAGIVLLWVLFITGCASGWQFTPPKFNRAAVPPSLSVSPAGQVESHGDAATPGTVTTSHTSATIPPGAVITISTGAPVASGTTANAATTSNAARPVVISSDSRQITTPTAFAPPAPPPPPSPVQLAQGRAVMLSYYAAAACAVAAGFLAYTGHGKAALIAAVAAVGTPALATFLSTEWALRFFIGAACIAGALFAAWHFLAARYPDLIHK